MLYCAALCCTGEVMYRAVQLLENQGKEEPVSIRKLDTVEEVLKESDVSSNCWPASCWPLGYTMH